jgi:hypothetical protein
MDDAQISALTERIESLCQNISESAGECNNIEHLIRIVGALECVFMSGHDDIDYEDDEGAERRADA